MKTDYQCDTTYVMKRKDKDVDVLRAEVERLRTDGASAIRWAPSSAYWSNVLVELFGPDARKGIDVLEHRLQALEERAQRDEALLRQALDALIWTTGSGDFSEGGQAREGALKLLFPTITALRERLGKG